MPPRTLYKITFQTAGKIYELYARDVDTSTLWGFVVIGDLVWDTDAVVIDPTEERLRDEFGATRRLHLPMHAVQKVEEVERKGQLAIRDSVSGDRIVTPFPLPSKPR
jgi:hypothetical protein